MVDCRPKGCCRREEDGESLPGRRFNNTPPSEIDFKASKSACSELKGNEWCNCIPLIENFVTGLLRRFEYDANMRSPV